MFLVSGANTGDKDTEDSGELAPYEITIRDMGHRDRYLDSLFRVDELK